MIGLYYPYIHFRDENWLKLALIYWSKISRIIPDGYATHDSDDVKRVAGSSDALITSHPMDGGLKVTRDFIAFIRQYSDLLQKKYSIDRSESWPIDPYTAKHARLGANPRLGYIFHEKMGHELAGLLVQENLAIHRDGNDPRWIGVHPSLANVYMTSLAEAIAGTGGYQLLADDISRHVTVGARNVKRLAQMLLKGDFEESEENLMSFDAIALCAIRIVLPRDLKNVRVEKIIELRQKHPKELGAFQAWIHGLSKRIMDMTGGVTSPKAMNEQLTVLEEQEVKPRIAELQRQFNSLGLATVTGVLTTKNPWEVDSETILRFVSQPPLKVAGMAFGAIPHVVRQQLEANKFVATNPAAYLLFAQEKLAPKSALAKVGTAARKFTLGT